MVECRTGIGPTFAQSESISRFTVNKVQTCLIVCVFSCLPPFSIFSPLSPHSQPVTADDSVCPSHLIEVPSCENGVSPSHLHLMVVPSYTIGSFSNVNILRCLMIIFFLTLSVVVFGYASLKRKHEWHTQN